MATKIRVAFDSNLWVSMAIGGRVATLADLLLRPSLETLVCPEILAEVNDVLQRPKLQRFLTPASIDAALDLLESGTVLVEVTQRVVRARDSKDDYLLALAQEYQLNYLVTGDKDLLVLGTHQQTQIVSFTDFAAQF